LPPVEYVTLDKRRDDAGGQHELVGRGSKRERIEEIRPRYGKCKNRGGDDPWQRHRNEDPCQKLEVARAVDQCGFVKLLWDALDRLFTANPEFSSAEADLLAARILEAKGSLPEALSAYERLSATYPGEEAKGRLALLLRRTGAEQRARAIFAEIRKSVERSPAFYRRAQREWYEIARRHA
jgi:hypothetical protein